MEKRVLVFGDLHIGVNKNNPKFFDITLDYADWLVSILEKNKINTIIQLGDIFHVREMIHSSAINCASKFFEKLKKYNIKIVTGNHDSLYNDSSEVNSLKLLKNWPNITVYEKVTSEDGFCFCGWGAKLHDIPDDQKAIFGHFDIKGFHMSSNKISEHGFSASDLMSKCQVLMSGHYHAPQLRMYGGRPLFYSGSAFQLNWGESGEKKFVYILNTETLEVERIENDISPKFEYIRCKDDLSKVANNFVSIEVDDPDKFSETVLRLKNLNALDVRTTTKPIKKMADSIAISEFKGVSIDDSIDEYCELLTVSDEEKQYASEHLKKLYKQCV